MQKALRYNMLRSLLVFAIFCASYSLSKAQDNALAPSCHGPDGKPLSTDPFEKPGDNHHFYQCTAGVLHTMPCANGTVFNPKIEACEHNASCNAPKCNLKVGSPSCIGPNGEPLSSGPFEKPGDCQHFYQCAAGVLHTMSCPSGTVFNPKTEACDWPYNVPGCSSTSATYEIKRTPEAGTWAEARVMCAKMGGDLLHKTLYPKLVGGKNYGSEILEALGEYNGWIGAHWYSQIDGLFETVDGEAFSSENQQNRIVNWASTEPNNGDREKCVHIWTRRYFPEFTLNNLGCNEITTSDFLVYGVCEILRSV